MKYEIKTTTMFERWFSSLKDKNAKLAINVRLLRMESGLFGDHKTVGSGLSELRIFIGKGYRIYYTIRNKQIILLVNGGHKDTQQEDIKLAKSLLKAIKD